MPDQDSAARQGNDAHHRRLLEREGVPYRLLVESVKDYAIYMLDPIGRVVSWNSGAERIKGYTGDEVIGSHVSLFYTPEDITAGVPDQELQKAVAEGRFETEGWRVRKDGSRFWADVVITSLRRRDGTLVGFVKITRDMTSRRDADRLLRESEERFRLLVSSVKDYAIFMLDPTGRITSWNDGAQRMKGYAASEVIGSHFSRFFPPEDATAGKPQRLLDAAAKDGRVEDEGWRVRKDGRRFFADVVITAVRDQEGHLRGFAKVVRDMTEKRKADLERQALMQARIRAEEISRAKDEFLMTLSHELRTPMTSILGWGRLLQSGAVDPAEHKTAIDAIVQSARAQASLIDDILDVSRLVAGKLRLQMARVDAALLAREAVAALAPTARSRGIEITTEINAEVGAIVADPDRLRQVIWNLLSNAIKFSAKGSRVALRMCTAGSNLEIVVEDHGEGIEPKFLPFLFEPFLQSDSSSTRPHGGLGLGLTIVRNIVHLHGGTVTAESEGLGRGARFRVVLPIAAVVPEKTEEPEPWQTMATMRLDGVRALYVDDHEASRDLVSSILHHAGARVYMASSVVEGMRIFRDETLDVVVTDIAMPESDGFDLLHSIRKRDVETGSYTPVIAFSAFGGSEHPRRPTADDHFDGWMKKPVEPASLVACLASVIARHSRGRQETA